MTQMMMKIPAQQATTYSIMIESHLLDHPDQWLPRDCYNKKLVIITDDNVKKQYGERLFDKLNKSKPLLLSFSPGEKSKNYQTKQYLEEQMIQSDCNRETIILSLGGGVVGDMAGFIAASYMRGISYIQLPTTLLAMVDSSIGGKTAINMPQGKNLVGAFWQPMGVVADLNCLTTLSDTHLINGLVEALKMFMISDVDYFNYANQHLDKILHRDSAILQNIVQQAMKIKIGVVSKDEKENNQRVILNFGHTIGHALEKISNYNLLHGYAVALGILVEAKISQLLGFLSSDAYQMIQSLFLRLNISGLQLKGFDFESIIQTTKRDKKIKSDHVRYVLLKAIGQVCNDDDSFTYPVSDEIVKKALFNVSEV